MSIIDITKAMAIYSNVIELEISNIVVFQLPVRPCSQVCTPNKGIVHCSNFVGQARNYFFNNSSLLRGQVN